MYEKRFYPFCTLMLILGLIIGSFPATTQKVWAQDNQNTAMDHGMKEQEVVTPSSGKLVNESFGAEQTSQNRLAFLKSLSREQQTSFANILTRYQPEFKAAINELNGILGKTGANKLFLPLVVDGDMERGNINRSGAPQHQEDREVHSRIAQAVQKVSNLQAKINADLVLLLTPDQRSLFEKLEINQQSESLIASSLQGIDEGQNHDDCTYAVHYGGVAFYWAAWAEYYSYLDYVNVGNVYSYSNFYYNHYAQANIIWALAHAATAWSLSNNGVTVGTWNDTSYNFFTDTLNDTYSGRYYAYQSWQLGSSYAGYAYDYADEAYAFEGLARTYIYYCY